MPFSIWCAGRTLRRYGKGVETKLPKRKKQKNRKRTISTSTILHFICFVFRLHFVWYFVKSNPKKSIKVLDIVTEWNISIYRRIKEFEIYYRWSKVQVIRKINIFKSNPSTDGGTSERKHFKIMQAVQRSLSLKHFGNVLRRQKGATRRLDACKTFYTYSPEPSQPLNREPKFCSIDEAVQCVKSGKYIS